MCFDDGGVHVFFVSPIEGNGHMSYVYGNLHVYCIDGIDLMSFIDIALMCMLMVVSSSYGLGYFAHRGS